MRKRLIILLGIVLFIDERGKYIMKEYSCPDCNIKTTSCKGCPRASSIGDPSKQFVDLSKLLKHNDIPSSCRHCATHPSNGGDGICWCVLGSYHITY